VGVGGFVVACTHLSVRVAVRSRPCSPLGEEEEEEGEWAASSSPAPIRLCAWPSAAVRARR
jgi:hypothetical protein